MTKQRPAKRGETTRTARRRTFLGAAGTAAVGVLAGCLGGGSGGEGGAATSTGGGTKTTEQRAQGGSADSTTIFHAGSLAAPFEAAEPKFEETYGVEVNREAKGSVGSTKKITQQGRSADVLGVSDFRLLRDMLVPKYGDWYAIFATNAMAVAYTEDSKYVDEFTRDNWWNVLARDDVSVAHSDPAVDPNGYRSVMAMELGAIPFEGETLYDESTATKMKENAKITSGTETNLISQLRSGKLDYAWEYASAGASHDVQVLDLQPHVDLSKATATYARHYAKADVKAGNTTYTGAPIAYGITVPSVAEAPGPGAKWVEYVITKPGEQILKENGFTPVEPAVTTNADAVPERVAKHAEKKDSLGPLTL